MKILTRHKIVESFDFPLSEALTFSILVWTLWGLGEALYWEKWKPLVEMQSRPDAQKIYLVAFGMYLVIAVLVAIVFYAGTKLTLVSSNRFESGLFRALTLSGILGCFFILVLTHYLPMNRSGHLISWLLIGFSIILTGIFFMKARDPEFRMRRSGTMLLSVLVATLVLSFVSFPIFSNSTGAQKDEDANENIRERLMAYRYLSVMVPSNSSGKSRP